MFPKIETLADASGTYYACVSCGGGGGRGGEFPIFLRVFYTLCPTSGKHFWLLLLLLLSSVVARESSGSNDDETFYSFFISVLFLL